MSGRGREVVLFLSGISVVNAAMTAQLALNRFRIARILFSGIAGGVEPGLNIGDVVIADRWGQYLELLLALARVAAADVAPERCTQENTCLERARRIVIGGAGVSGGAFVDNAAFRGYTFETFGARVLDMERAAVAHVAWANRVPFITIRSLSDLTGGSEQRNQLEVFFRLAAGNAAAVVKVLLRAPPKETAAAEWSRITYGGRLTPGGVAGPRRRAPGVS